MVIKAERPKARRKASPRRHAREGGRRANLPSEFVYFFTTTHELKWTTKEPVPVAEIANSLLALERIVKLAPKALEGITQVEIAGVEVYVQKIESGSLIDEILVKLLFKDKENMDAFLAKIHEDTKKPGMTRNIVIGTVITAIIGYGAYLAATAGNKAGTTTITATNNTIINIGAGEVSMTPDAFKAIVETAVNNKKELAKNTTKLFNPARADGQASIIVDGNNDLSFSPSVIAATPRLKDFDKQEKMERLVDVDLQIRALDRDSGKHGWACVIPGVIEKRVKLKLDDTVRPADIVGKFSVRANVYVYYKLDRAGKKMVPDYVKLFELVDDE